ncbi:MAG: hypothetical protein GX131_12550 [candidate division WS1 bacterium]|jgi:hypothetical protein|nr:hypothetical protein [candidate division WS1 bacterium]
MSERRDFFKRLGRVVSGAALVGGTGWLALGTGKPCWSDGGCRNCPQLQDCDEQEARITRLQTRPQTVRRDYPTTGEEPRE